MVIVGLFAALLGFLAVRVKSAARTTLLPFFPEARPLSVSANFIPLSLSISLSLYLSLYLSLSISVSLSLYLFLSLSLSLRIALRSLEANFLGDSQRESRISPFEHTISLEPIRNNPGP